MQWTRRYAWVKIEHQMHWEGGDDSIGGKGHQILEVAIHDQVRFLRTGCIV
jgi:hypothetical protein